MWRVENKGKRAFISKADSVLKGGEKIPGSNDVAINPGLTAEVTDEYGSILATYSDIKVLSRPSSAKKKEEKDVVESTKSK